MSLTPIPSGSDVQANTYTTSDQRYSSVTALSDGGFVVTWSSLGQDGSVWGVYGQRYASDGTPVDGEFRANSHTTIEQLYSSVTALSDGGFVVTWSSEGQDGSGWGIYGQRYASDGTPVDGEFRANSHTTFGQLYSSVTALSDGGFVVTWSSLGQEDGSSWGIYGQRYAQNGSSVGSEFQVNTYTTSDQISSSVNSLSGGGFVVTWSSSGQDGSGDGIYGQRYASDGTALGSEFRVNTYTTSFQASSSVTSLSDGGFVVTWSSLDQDGSNWGIRGQRYSENGAPEGSEFQVNTYTTFTQSHSSVTSLSDGGFVVTWSSFGQDGSGGGIYGQRFAENGAPIGSEFLLNQTTAGQQVAETFYGSETVAALADGRLVQVWSGTGLEEVFFRLIDVPTPPVFTSGSTNSLAENAPTSVVVYDANATDDDTVAYSLSGTDSALFSIDAQTGEVRFLASPDFESPDDAGGDNVYDITVHASDGALEATKAVAITVRNVDPSTGFTPIALGSDVQVNTYTTSEQRYPSVTALSDGGFVVTWTSLGQDGSGQGIYGQRYAANGAPVGGEFRANSYTTGDQRYSPVTALSDGGFVVTWESSSQDDGTCGIYGQRYGANGTPVGAEFRANTYTAGQEFYPSVVGLDDGGFVVTWSSSNHDVGFSYGVYGQRYASDGTPVGGEFRVNSYATGVQYLPSVTALADGGFVVTWASIDQDGGGQGVYGQRYGVDGTPVGGEFRANSYTTGDQWMSSVTGLADGGFVVTWESNGQDGGGYGIYGQRYGADGTPVGGEFRANTYTTSAQEYSSVTALSDGGFVVTWSSLGQDGSSYGIYGQRYGADGTAIGSEFRANQITAGNQVVETFYGSETVAALADGRLVQVWSGFGTEEVFFRLLDVSWGDNGVPVITSNGGGATAVVSIAENTTAVTTVSADDPNAGQPLTYSLAGGADEALFTINETTGALAFLTAPDFEDPNDANEDNAYEVVVEVSDGAGGVDSQAINVSVTNVNAAPVITSGATGQVAEGAPIATVAYDAAATDDGENGGSLSYSLSSGGDNELFNINAGTGVVTFKASPNFEAPGDAGGNNVYDITVHVSDGDLEDTQSVSITVTDQNDVAPTITTAAALSVAENMTTVAVLASTDPDTVGTSPAPFSITGGTDAVLFEVSGSNLVFKSASDYETDAHSYQVEVTASDGVNHSAKLLTINLTDQNDNAPVITTEAALSVAENTLVVAALASTDVDTVGTAPAEFSVSGGTDAALFEVASGNLVFKTARNFETDPHSYQVEVTASDGTNQSAKLLTVTLTDLSGVTITGTAGNDTVDATTTVPGQPLPTPEDDIINGLAGTDSLSGLGGNDRVDGGTDADAMIGGPGNDTYVVDNAGDDVTELDNEGIDEVESSITYTLGSHVERLTLTGSQAIDGTGNSLANRITGNSMANRIDGGAGQDDMTGLAGDDTYLVDQETDAITEATGGGTDLVISTALLFTLPAEIENLTLAMGAGDTFGVGNGLANTLLGNAGINTLVGNAGADTLDGGAGADYLLGGAGNDLYKVDDTFDLVDEGGAFPTFAGSALDFDTISSTAEWFWDVYSVGERMQIEEGAVGSDGAGTTIVGSVFSNEMIGNSGTNVMFGRGGADSYRAGDGVDWISLNLLGVTEENSYVGVDGVNTIIVDARTTGTFSYDIIFDFEVGKDKIDVSDYGYATAAEVMQRGHDDGFGNSYYALGDGFDYVYLVGVTTGQVQSTDFVV